MVYIIIYFILFLYCIYVGIKQRNSYINSKPHEIILLWFIIGVFSPLLIIMLTILYLSKMKF